MERRIQRFMKPLECALLRRASTKATLEFLNASRKLYFAEGKQIGIGCYLITQQLLERPEFACKLTFRSTFLATFFSAFTTPMLAALFSVGIWMIGHLSRDLRALGEQSELESVSRATNLVFQWMPDFEVFNKTLEAVHGLAIPSSEVWMAIVYAVGYTVCTLLIGSMIFSRRDFK